MRQYLLLMTMALAVLVAACSTAPYTGRRQLLMVSESGEITEGARTFEVMKRRLPVVRDDPALNQMVQRVGQRLAAAANRPDYQWEYVVFFNDKEANAFCLPGGKVGLYTGILKYTQDETGLATVLAHEMAHALARHAAERQSQAMLAQVGGLGLGLGLGGVGAAAGQAIMGGYSLGTQLGLHLPYSRAQELEADKIGLILMAKAGYDPAAALDFWKRMMAKERSSLLPQFLSTHPKDDNRIQEMTEFLPQAEQYYLPAASPPAPQAATPEAGTAPLAPKSPQAAPVVPPPSSSPPRVPAPAPSPAPRTPPPAATPEPHDDLELQPLGTDRTEGQTQPEPPPGQWAPTINSK